MLLINGLLNNSVIPIAAKIASVYNLSDGYVSSPVTVSFLIYTLMNFPANHIIDKKGLRFSFLVGGGLFVGGAVLYTMVNYGYMFVLVGAILVTIGQPFIINVPTKIATYWFLDKNRPFATSLMTGMMLICSGVGFLLPTVLVSEEATLS
jgi:MFS family permease